MSFELYFLGAEIPGWRRMLMDQQVPHVGLSFMGLKRRGNKHFKIEEKFPEDQKVLVESGAFSINKSADYSRDDWVSYLDAYLDFVEANIDRIYMVTEFDALSLGQQAIEDTRLDFWDQIPSDKFLPVWHDAYGLRVLEAMCERYERLAVVGQSVVQAPNLVAKLNSLTQRYGTQLHGSAIARPEMLRDVRFSSAATSSWLSGSKYGETIVWDGLRIRRYPKRYKEQARRRHRMQFTKAGFDATLIENDDPNEVTRFTLWSWRHLEDAVARQRGERNISALFPTEGDEGATTPDDEDEDEIAEIAAAAVDTPPDEVRKSNQLVPRPPEERQVLPVLVMQTVESTDDQGEPSQVATITQRSLKRCDTCYVATTCPAMKPGSECAYEIPVQIRNKTELKAAMTALTEMQMQRIAFARFIEESQGGQIDMSVSLEIDRFYNMMIKQKDIEDTRAYVEANIKMRGEAGAISRIFGQQIGDQAKALPEPVSSDELMKDVVDAEVVP